MIRRTYHKCKLCGSSITCDMNYLKEHFRRRHSISLKEYSKQTGCTIILLGRYPTDNPILESLKVSKTLEQTCTFTCKECNKNFLCSASLRNHMKVYHKGKQYALANFLLTGSSFQCEMCPTMMLCDRRVISQHLRTVHNIKATDIHFPAKIWKEKYDKFCKTFKENITVSSKVWKRTVVSAENIPTKQTTPVIGNLCTFKCPTCASKLFTSWSKFWRHMKLEHHQAQKFCPTLVVTARYHSCLICPKAVLGDRSFIFRHLRQTHKTPLDKYEKTFIRYGGQTLPLFNEWLFQADIQI